MLESVHVLGRDEAVERVRRTAGVDNVPVDQVNAHLDDQFKSLGAQLSSLLVQAKVEKIVL